MLKGHFVGRNRDADDDHYQILITDGETQHRISVNVTSRSTNGTSELMFQTLDQLPSSLTKALRTLQWGYSPLKSKRGGIAQDYVRGAIVDPAKMKPANPHGKTYVLRKTLEEKMRAAFEDDGTVIYSFGQRWGPERKRKDEYFHFLPGNGMHDIHMNQGSGGKWKKDNGTWQDGCLVMEFSGNKWFALFLSLDAQSFATNDKGAPVKDTEKARAQSSS